MRTERRMSGSARGVGNRLLKGGAALIAYSTVLRLRLECDAVIRRKFDTG
jgi:hypothetical protein